MAVVESPDPLLISYDVSVFKDGRQGTRVRDRKRDVHILPRFVLLAFRGNMHGQTLAAFAASLSQNAGRRTSAHVRHRMLWIP